MTAVTAGVTGPPRRSFWRRSMNSRTAYTFMLPALLVMAIITFYPLVFQVWMSFTDYGLKNLKPTAPPPNYVGFDNYIQILDNNIVLPNFDFLRILTFNLFWAFSNVVIHVILGVAIAICSTSRGSGSGPSTGPSTSCRSSFRRSLWRRSGGTCSTRSTGPSTSSSTAPSVCCSSCRRSRWTGSRSPTRSSPLAR